MSHSRFGGAIELKMTPPFLSQDGGVFYALCLTNW